MIPVFQTMSLANDGQGNCFNACVASILERSLRDVAAIYPRDPRWHSAWDEWFAAQGLMIFHHGPKSPPRGYSIASGYSARLFPEGHEKAGERIPHACVAFDGVVVHDPFPIPASFDRIGLFSTLIPLPVEQVD